MRRVALFALVPLALLACKKGNYGDKVNELPLETKTVETKGKKITIDVPKALELGQSTDGVPEFHMPAKEGNGTPDATLEIAVSIDSGGLPLMSRDGAEKFIRDKVKSDLGTGGQFHLTGLSYLNTTAYSLRNFKIPGMYGTTAQCRAEIKYSSSPSPPIDDALKKRHAGWLHKICSSMKVTK